MGISVTTDAAALEEVVALSVNILKSMVELLSSVLRKQLCNRFAVADE